ncbi:MAG: sugar transporter permease [Eubacterium sp.]|jgi:multiple sugar transport system permease protein|nr:sugar transporter permease [Eubacterium sp.]
MNKQNNFKKILGKSLVYLALIIISFLFILPFWQIISTSLKTFLETTEYPQKFFPKDPQWKNYYFAFVKNADIWPVALWLKNTVFTTLMVVIGNVLSGLFIAYGFARFNGRGKNIWFMLIISTMLIPVHSTLVPLFMVYKQLNWYNTFLPIIVPPFFGFAVYIFLLRQFIMGIPKELDEAATIDGASPVGILFKIIVPLAKPSIIAVGVMCFIAAWGDFFTPLIFLSDIKKYTISVGVSIMQSQMRMNLTDTHLIACVITVVTLPSLIIFFAAQKYFVSGLTLGAVKG